MCGPADFGALHTSLTRLAALFLAGAATYGFCKLVTFCRQLRLKQRAPEEARGDLPGTLPVQVSVEHPNS
jgi:hypothetical protein